MTGNPAWVSVLALTGCLVCLSILSATGRARAQSAAPAPSLFAQTQSPSPSESNTVSVPTEKKSNGIRFDIARQPLSLALEQYAVATGLPVFFDSALAAGRLSSAVQGVYTPAAALTILLEGSGLVAGNAGTGPTDAFVLKLADTAQPASDAAAGNEVEASQRMVYRRYDGLVQTRIREAFCNNADAAPGSYRTAVQFSIDPVGRIVNAALLASTGDTVRDGAIVATLKQIRIDRPPPADMAQPITMVILPRTLASGLECRASAPH